VGINFATLFVVVVVVVSKIGVFHGRLKKKKTVGKKT
jgi:hypothetical protein